MADEKKAPPEPEGPGQPVPEHKVTVKMHDKPQIAPDGHPNLSQEDIDARA